MNAREALACVTSKSGDIPWTSAMPLLCAIEDALREKAEREEKEKPKRPSLEQLEARLRERTGPSQCWCCKRDRNPCSGSIADFAAAAETFKVVREEIVPALKRCVETGLLSGQSSVREEKALAAMLLSYLGIPEP